MKHTRNAIILTLGLGIAVVMGVIAGMCAMGAWPIEYSLVLIPCFLANMALGWALVGYEEKIR